MPAFYETESEPRWWAGIFGRSVIAIFLLIVLGFLASGLALGFGTVLAPIFGRAHAYQKQQSGDNRIFAQQQFHDLNQDYLATVRKIPRYKEQAKTGDTAAVTNLQGLQSHCDDVVGEYNAAALKYLSKDFRDNNLPPTLDSSACN